MSSEPPFPRLADEVVAQFRSRTDPASPFAVLFDQDHGPDAPIPIRALLEVRTLTDLALLAAAAADHRPISTQGQGFRPLAGGDVLLFDALGRGAVVSAGAFRDLMIRLLATALASRAEEGDPDDEHWAVIADARAQLLADDTDG